VIVTTTTGATTQRAPTSSYVVASRISGRWKHPWKKPVTTAARRMLVSAWMRGRRYPRQPISSPRMKTVEITKPMTRFATQSATPSAVRSTVRTVATPRSSAVP
jgi:hypothetical protein